MNPKCKVYAHFRSRGNNPPDPPTLAFLEKSKGNPEKARVFLFAEILKSLEKKGKTHQKSKENRKTKKARKSKKAGIGGSGPDPPILAFFDFLAFLCVFPIFLAFLCVFPLFSKDFRGSAKRKTLAFLGKSPCFFFIFQKSKDWRVRELRGRSRKRAVLANVPSIRLLVLGNIRMYLRSVFWCRETSDCSLVPFFGTGEHLPKPPFWKPPCLANPQFVRNGKTEKQPKHKSRVNKPPFS